MPCFAIETPQRNYSATVERGILERVREFVPNKAGMVFVVSTEDVWKHQGANLERGLAGLPHETLFLPGGEENKRLAPLETLAERMVELGADRSSLVIAFGGGIVNDMAGFLAAMFMRGIPVLQIPTTLLAQVDAAVGGKTGVNLVSGKNLIGSFHQPVAVLIDPDTLSTLPEREYRAGLFEVVKCGIIRSGNLFWLMTDYREAVIARHPGTVDEMVAECVRIKAEVVTADEREGDLRRILNYGHTIGHALEAETGYTRFLHGEAVAFGMLAVTRLAENFGILASSEARQMEETIGKYGPIPTLEGIAAENLLARLSRDKKAVQGKVHFVVAEKIGQVRVVSGIDESLILASIREALR